MDAIRLDALMADDSTRRVGTHRVHDNNGSLYGLLPAPFAAMIGAEKGGEYEVFVNMREGVIVHKFDMEEDDA